MREPMRSPQSARSGAIALKVTPGPAENRYRGVPKMRPSLELLAIALTGLALTAPQVCAQTLGEVTAATGIHSTLQGNAVGSSTRALDTVNRSLAKSTKPRDYDFASPSGAKGGYGPPKRSKKLALRSETVARSNGSWITASHESKGSASTAWGKGGAGWDAPGNAGWASGGNGWESGGGSSHRR